MLATSPVLPHTISSAASAPTTAVNLSVEVLASQRVAVAAMSLGSVGGNESVASKYILSWSDRFKMVWANALSHATEMVHVHPFGDRAIGQLIRKPMGEHAGGIEREVPILLSASGAASSPEPTVGSVEHGALSVNERKEARCDSRVGQDSLRLDALCSPLTHVVLIAQAFRVGGFFTNLGVRANTHGYASYVDYSIQE